MNITHEQIKKIKEALYLAGYFAENPSKEQTEKDKFIVKEAWSAFYAISRCYESLTDEEKAFMESFKETHGQYDISDEAIIDFLHGNTECFSNCFDGYTQLADARNLWWDAINFTKGATK